MNEPWKRLIEAERRVMRLESLLQRQNTQIVSVAGAIQNDALNVMNPFGVCEGGGGGGDACETFQDTLCMNLEWFTHNWGGGLPKVYSSTNPTDIGFDSLPPLSPFPVTIPNSVSANCFTGATLAKTSETSGQAVFEYTSGGFYAYAKLQSIFGTYNVIAYMWQYFTMSGFDYYFRIGTPYGGFVPSATPALFGTSGSASYEGAWAGSTIPSSPDWIAAGDGTTARIKLSWGSICGTGSPVITPGPIADPDPKILIGKLSEPSVIITPGRIQDV